MTVLPLWSGLSIRKEAYAIVLQMKARHMASLPKKDEVSSIANKTPPTLQPPSSKDLPIA
jgi:hypothetical protein